MAMACSTDRLVDGLVCGAARVAAHAVQDGPGGLPDGSLVYRFGGWFQAGLASCPTARSRRFGGGYDSRQARRLAQQLAHRASLDGSVEMGPGVLPGGSRDNCFTEKIRKGIRSHTRPSWVWAGARSYSSWLV